MLALVEVSPLPSEFNPGVPTWVRSDQSYLSPDGSSELRLGHESEIRMGTPVWNQALLISMTDENPDSILQDLGMRSVPPANYQPWSFDSRHVALPMIRETSPDLITEVRLFAVRTHATFVAQCDGWISGLVWAPYSHQVLIGSGSIVQVVDERGEPLVGVPLSADRTIEVAFGWTSSEHFRREQPRVRGVLSS
jgi:hypothetical protein